MRIASLRRRFAAGTLNTAAGLSMIAALTAVGVPLDRKFGSSFRVRVPGWVRAALCGPRSSGRCEPSKGLPRLLAIVSLLGSVRFRNARGPGARVMRVRRIDLATGGPVTLKGAVVEHMASTVCTALLRRLSAPLQHRARAKLRAIDGEVQQLRRECGDDGQALQRALMELYKRHDVNPLAGWAPTLAIVLVSWLPVLLSALNQSFPERLAGTVVAVDP